MKNNIIRGFATLLLGAISYFAVENYTGEDLILEDGTVLETEQLSHHVSSKYKDREIDTVTVYLHHTVTSKNASVESINQIHINNGWERLSYHVLIRDNGTIQLINPFSKYTYHTKGKNQKGIAIALVGNYEEEKPSKEMIEATRYVIETLCNTPNLYVESIKGHKDVKATLCPGKYAYSEFKDLFYNATK